MSVDVTLSSTSLGATAPEAEAAWFRKGFVCGKSGSREKGKCHRTALTGVQAQGPAAASIVTPKHAWATLCTASSTRDYAEPIRERVVGRTGSTSPRRRWATALLMGSASSTAYTCFSPVWSRAQFGGGAVVASSIRARTQEVEWAWSPQARGLVPLGAFRLR